MSNFEHEFSKQWEGWIKQAAEEHGITKERVSEKLASGQAYMVVSFVVNLGPDVKAAVIYGEKP